MKTQLIHLARCNNESCVKKAKCYRYMAEDYKELPLISFEYICGELNGFKWLYEIGNNPVRKLALEGGD